jgi:hypothetical protein
MGEGFDSRRLHQVVEIIEEIEFFVYVSLSLSARIIRKVMSER